MNKNKKIVCKRRSEENFRRIVAYASYFAITIACFGLFGITSLSVARRLKEMGIRKVLGASVGKILALFNQEFIVLLIIANLLAWPGIYLAMNSWLNNFAYKIDLGISVFLISGLGALLLAMITISVQAMKAAYSNPADILRHE